MPLIARFGTCSTSCNPVRAGISLVFQPSIPVRATHKKCSFHVFDSGLAAAQIARVRRTVCEFSADRITSVHHSRLICPSGKFHAGNVSVGRSVMNDRCR